MFFVNGCSTPDRVPPDKAVSDKEKGRMTGGQKREVEGYRESHHRENRQGRKDECSDAEKGLRWRSETREAEGDVRGEREEAGDMKEGEINM